MIHNVDSHVHNTASSNAHPLSNCVHKHDGFLDTETPMKGGSQSAAAQNSGQESKTDILGFLTDHLKQGFSKGIGFFKGIWNDSPAQGNKEIGNSESAEKMAVSNIVNNGKDGIPLTAVTAAMENVADIKAKEKPSGGESERFSKLSAVLPALKAKTQQSRERFEAKKDVLLKKLKKMAKEKNRSFGDHKQDHTGQQEKNIEWLEMENAHLLDSYNEKGEYANLGNRIDGQGYGGSATTESYSKKV